MRMWSHPSLHLGSVLQGTVSAGLVPEEVRNSGPGWHRGQATATKPLGSERLQKLPAADPWFVSAGPGVGSLFGLMGSLLSEVHIPSILLAWLTWPESGVPETHWQGLWLGAPYSGAQRSHHPKWSHLWGPGQGGAGWSQPCAERAEDRRGTLSGSGVPWVPFLYIAFSGTDPAEHLGRGGSACSLLPGHSGFLRAKLRAFMALKRFPMGHHVLTGFCDFFPPRHN